MKVSYLVVTHPSRDGRHSTSLDRLLTAPEYDWDRRLRFLYGALAERIPRVEILPTGNLNPWETLRAGATSFTPNLDVWRQRFHKNAYTFVRKSLRSETELARLACRADLVFHVQGLFAPVWHASAPPYVMYLDFNMALSERDWPPWAPFRTTRDRSTWMACERRAYSRAAHIFTWSDYARQSLIDDYGVAPHRLTTVGAAGNFQAPSDQPKDFRGGTLLFVSSNFTRKGGDVLFAAVSRLRRTRPDLKLLVLGAPVPSTPPGVEHLGYLSTSDAMAQVFERADLLILPSRCEPYGMVLVEAMNHGVPCIVTNTGGMPEIVEHGVTGLVVEKGDPDQLAAAIARLLDAPAEWRAMSESSRQRVRTQLNWDVVASRIVEVVQAL